MPDSSSYILNISGIFFSSSTKKFPALLARLRLIILKFRKTLFVPEIKRSDLLDAKRFIYDGLQEDGGREVAWEKEEEEGRDRSLKGNPGE
ncbi:hypothetical protein GWI33_003212 [Rhynchophorus ferrugineus]|uniref:Uncharacterized protein n=1 Tax=Rhynchophorus ferrugineus TaxID=354439 RepID=A0A834J302_RHYFE|nr:hypothetical protein GWI33_003212 [Rhynchophorus ferrugineus]